MSETLPKPWTTADFLDWEARQPERYEFVDGILRAMGGGGLAHNTIVGNLRQHLAALGRSRGCRTFAENVKVPTPLGDVTYPDIVVTCDPVKPTDDRVEQPMLIAEVLSRSTADYDRGSKLETYRRLPSLRVYLLVAQDRRSIDCYRCIAEGWALTTVEGIGALPLPELGGTVALDDIYMDSGA